MNVELPNGTLGDGVVACAPEENAGSRPSVPRWLIAILGVTVVGTAGLAVFMLRSGKPAIADYDSNLEMILTQTGRNTNHDSSPFHSVPQDELDVSDTSPLITTDRSEYLEWGPVGEDNLHQEFAFPTGNGGQFRTACEFSHFAYDDPILNPDQPGAAHLHMFFGNTDINAYSTYESMRDTGSSTCNGAELNRTGYWAPAMIDPDPLAPGGAWVRIPERVVVYYKGELLANGSNPESQSGGSQVYRPGMANVAPQPGVAAVASTKGGAASAVAAEWKCTSNFSPPGDPETVGSIPLCSGDQFAGFGGTQWTVLEMQIKFPNCFNTAKADDDYTAWEMVGPNDWYVANCTGELQGEAGSDYEIFPHLEYFVNYRVDAGDDTSDWYLSSDVSPDDFEIQEPRGSTTHGDWWGAWQPDINQEWVDNCVNTGWGVGESEQLSGCGFGYLSDGGTDIENPEPGRALSRRPEWNGPDKVPLQTLFDELCVPNNPNHDYSDPPTGAYCRP